MPDPRIKTAFTHQQAGRLDQAAKLYREILAQHPGDSDTLHLLGIITAKTGNPADGIKLIQRAITVRPDIAGFHSNLAFAFRLVGRDAEAISALERALALEPNQVTTHNEIGNILRNSKRLDEAAESFRKAIAMNPAYAEAIHNLALTLADSGRIEQAIQQESRAMELAPDVAAPASSRCYMLNFHPAFDRAAIAAEMRKFNERFALPLAGLIPPRAGELSPDRRLRIGYVSPDFYFQSECFFVLPLLKNHDRRDFEIHCYSSVARPDHVTRQIRESVEIWHDVAAEPDDRLTDRIRADQIDILVDLTMHMRGNRLLLFARKPAPIQVTWLAYPGGTGLTAIDYRLTDAFMDPPDADADYAEKSIRLPSSWCCFDPLFQTPLGPDRREGFVRFGSLNNPVKLNEPTLALWSRVLQSVPDSRLLLLATSEEHRTRIRRIFSAAGVEERRLEFTGYVSRPDYLRLYDQIDLCLDPLPYNGITTTLDALWMGVPVVTLAGATAAGRAGLSILTTVGMPELVAQNPDEFIQIASRGRDLPLVRIGRAEIRRRFHQSPLMDAKRFAVNVESAYRKIWETFKTQSSP